MLKRKWNFLIAMGSIFSIHFTASAFEVENEKNIDIYGNFGYTNLSGFSFEKTEKLFNHFTGYNLGVSALYSFQKNTYFTPVAGISFNTVFTKSNDSSIGDYNASAKFNYTSIAAIGGAKFFPTDSITIYTLANLGYVFSNNITANFNSNDSFSNYISSQTSFSARNHYFYGATLMGTYNIGETFRLGSSFAYNRHTMTLDYMTYPQTITESSSFNEYSINIIAMWSF